MVGTPPAKPGTSATTAPNQPVIQQQPAPLAPVAPVAPTPMVMSGSHFTHLIPPLTANIGEWALKVRRVLEQKDIDFDSPDIAKMYVPFIMKNLPAYMLSSFKKNITLEEALVFLEKFDNRGGDLSERLARDKIMSDKPSLTYLMLVDEMQKKMPGMDLAGLKKVAWKDLKNGFPSIMRIYLPSFHIIDYPNESQLKELDDSWEQFELSAPTTPARVSAVSANTAVTPRQDNVILDRLSELENRMRQDMSSLRLHVNAVTSAPVQTNANNAGRFYGQNNSNGFPNRATNYAPATGANGNFNRNFNANANQQSGFSGERKLSRKEVFDNRADKRYCYYHFHFGKDAIKCDSELLNCPIKNQIATVPGRVAR